MQRLHAVRASSRLASALEAVPSLGYGKQSLTPDGASAVLAQPIAAIGDTGKRRFYLLELAAFLIREAMENVGCFAVGGNVGPIRLCGSRELPLLIGRLSPDSKEGATPFGKRLLCLAHYLIHRRSSLA
jgi:hypothetical protein